MPERRPSTTMATARCRYVTRVMLATSAMAPVTNQGRGAPPGTQPSRGRPPKSRKAAPMAAHQTRAASAAGSTGARSSISASEARSGFTGVRSAGGGSMPGDEGTSKTGSRGGRTRARREGRGRLLDRRRGARRLGGRGGSGRCLHGGHRRRLGGLGARGRLCRPGAWGRLRLHLTDACAPAGRTPTVPEMGGGSLVPLSPVPCGGGKAGSGSGPLARGSALPPGAESEWAALDVTTRSGSLFRGWPASSPEAGRLAPELPGGRVGFCEGEARGKGAREFSHTSEALGIDSK